MGHFAQIIDSSLYSLISFFFLLSFPPPVSPQAYIFKCLSYEYTDAEIHNSLQRKHVNVLYSILRNSSLMHMCTCVLVEI